MCFRLLFAVREMRQGVAELRGVRCLEATLPHVAVVQRRRAGVVQDHCEAQLARGLVPVPVPRAEVLPPRRRAANSRFASTPSWTFFLTLSAYYTVLDIFFVLNFDFLQISDGAA